jgi:hypothetical protein
MAPTEGEGLAAVAIGEQAEVADLDEACGQDVEQEAADELRPEMWNFGIPATAMPYWPPLR